MKIKRFRAENFRNIAECDISFSDGVNLLFGKNAQGKTNAIEGIYLFSRGRSFRTSDDRDMVRFGADGFRISIEYDSLDGEGTLEYASFGREKRRMKNGYKVSSVREMIGSFRSVLFYPDNLDLVKGGPDERRSFLNVAISQCEPSYITEYSRLKAALENRNSLLKAANKGQYYDPRELVAWSESMALYASYVYDARMRYTERLGKYVTDIGLMLSEGKERVEISYKSDIDSLRVSRECAESLYREIFTSHLEREMAAGTSLYGPHRDDILVDINGSAARAFASQGQQRSTVLAMKLAEGEVIKEIYGEYPVFLFDDVLSELDKSRRSYVLGGMKDRQVIITSCEGEEITEGAKRIFEVKGGSYVSSHR